MAFDVGAALRRSTGRAKSDVANKLVSMFLHDVSRKACAANGMTVSDLRYAEAVLRAFGRSCLYCERELTAAIVPVVEHLNGMNRVSVGLHVPGNVAMACKACNNQKREDDQKLRLAENGWESFLSHDGTRCSANCKTCDYWRTRWPDDTHRITALIRARRRVAEFQAPFSYFVHWSFCARSVLRDKTETLYRACQRFATDEIERLVSEVKLDFEGSKPPSPS